MTGLFDWSATPSSNTTVDGINIAEGCPSGNMNNAVRSVMALVRQSFTSGLANFLSGTSPLAVGSGGTGGANPADARTALGAASTADAVPVGAVFHFAASTAPTGFLVCNGSAVSRTTYAALFAIVSTTYGAGDGSTTFNLPDLRGEFIRGFDGGRGVDSGRTFGSAQADELKSHTHTVPKIASQGINHDGSLETDTTIYSNQTQASGSAGGSETRPRNIALLPCIKF